MFAFYQNTLFNFILYIIIVKKMVMNNKNIFKGILMSIFIFNSSNLFSQTIKTKDGVIMGDRKELIYNCIEGAKNASGTLNLAGFEIGIEEYCNCVADRLFPTLTSTEIIQAMQQNSIQSLFFKNDNLEIIMSCVEGAFDDDEDAFSDTFSDYKIKSSENPSMAEFQREIAIKSCIQGFDDIPKEELDFEEVIFTDDIKEEFCSCASDKILSKGYTFNQLSKADNENSDAFNEVILPCLSQVLQLNKDSYENSFVEGNVYGGGNSSRVPLVDYLGMGYKLKINLGGVERYFLLDTGATDIIIDRDTERELLLSGVLTRDSYGGKSEYQMANNEIVEAQIAKVKKIVIGDYTVTDVKIAIFDNGALLCGISFLDRFKKWEIDKKSNSLILYK